MKKITLALILTLILITSLVKNSTKEIEDLIFIKRENVRLLSSELGDVMLEFNYLSSPEKLIQYQSQYFENKLKKTDISKIKKISLEKGIKKIIDFTTEEAQTNE